jgi:peptidoglycan hydrolase-like protein with peptidoglycan-binding domain
MQLPSDKGKEVKSMVPQRFRSIIAGALALGLALPGWTAEESKVAPAKEEKASVKGSEDTKKLQEALKAKGHDPGLIDGIMGPKTRAALKAFQEANGIKGTGRLDDPTAEKLGLAKPEPPTKKEVKKMKEEKK